ncbi:hypothetical protein R3P38DRAFT_2715514 [Favolaschia claudopus]|uniref:DUF6589 domain-containing protein n=1 Tax=Favolaschia claudopus TaxID=2862362 RepID=A0AAW0AY88_9AGAR
MDGDLEFLYIEEPPIEPDYTHNNLANEADFPELPDADPPQIPQPFYSTNTRNLRSCVSDKTVQYARSSLMNSEELPRMLERWHSPPRRSGGQRPAGARKILLDFAFRCISDAVDTEMKVSAPMFLSPPDKLSETHLTDLDFGKFKNQLKESMPIFWHILRRAAYTAEQETRNKHKNPDMTVLHLISQMQYSRSNRRGRIAKLWSIYLKACGLSARAFDALHALGILMSHKWTAEALETLSDRAMDLVQQLIHLFPFAISHDNMNVPLRVFSQRLHNQSHFISGCAYTVWILPRHAALPADTSQMLQSFRAENCLQVFDFSEVLYGSLEAEDRMEAWDIDHVLHLLLDCPEFLDYPHRTDAQFHHPPPVDQLPGGPENIIQGFVLKTSTFEEASYDGTLNVIDDTFRQLLLNSPDEQKVTGTQRVIAWMGDQLTVERLRGLWKYRHEDHNAFDRLDYMIPVFGWFHLVMAFANSIHKQYLGDSSATGGLRQAFDLLNRKGLITQSTKGPFWHNLDEALHHISEAHFRACWLDVGKVKTLADLKSKSPSELRHLAGEIIRKYASREALNNMEEMDSHDRDSVFQQWTMFNMDVLPYLQLRKAIKAGDIGRIEDLLPTLLFRFAGSGSSKYTIEILELLQGLHREWPPVVRDYIKRFCWLMTRNGEFDGWLPYDLAQEENICDIKVNYRSQGPGATMEYMGKISPAIPALRKIQRHVEKQFGTNSRGARHGVPDKEKDVSMLTANYVASKLHTFVAGRELRTARSPDFLTEGADTLERLNTINDWFKRRTHARATGEDWSEEERQDILLQPLLA